MNRHRPARLGLGLVCLLVPGLLLAPPGGAQGATERPPNLSGGWVDEPGTIHFNLLHRFWMVGAGDDDKLVNSPTMLVAVPAHSRVLVGAQYATNSLVAVDRFNEWELFGRWAPLDEADAPVGVAVTAAYNSAAGSGDGELALTLPLGPVRLLGAGRAFSDALGSGEAGWSAAGGVVLRARPNLTFAADVGTLQRDGDWPGEGAVWGAGVQLRIPATPHTLSLQATNTRTGTLQGQSGSHEARRTVWGFEFTVPLTLERYIPALRDPPAAVEAVPEATGDTVHVTMTPDLRFAPDTIRIQEGQTVVWDNPTQEVHTVTADPDAVRNPDQVVLPEGAEPFDSGNMFTDDVFRHTFTVPGEYMYVCVPHDLVDMVGVVLVEPGEP